MDDGERQYEWEAGRRLKKMIVQGDPADGIEDGFDEGSATTLKLEFSNGNLLANGVADTVITAKVYRKGEEVTDEYVATAFNWTRTSGNESADASWNAAHSGMKSITVSANELTDDIQIQCTLTGTSSSYGSVNVNDSFIASHTRGVADSNDTLSLEDGTLFVTTDDDNYRLSGNELKALYPRLNGTVTANAWIYHTQPLKTIEFKYNSPGLRVQKKVTANGKTEVTDYTLHGKLVTHMTVGNDKLHFFYDAQSRPTKVNFNGTTYIYLHNLQGDVVGIIDNGGNLVVKYKYDAWGRSISITGLLAATLGIRNPFRYRGYVYDDETELYYLRSRYYNPTVGRFVNADVRVRENVFSYATGNPVKNCDFSGLASVNVVSGIVAGAVAGVKVALAVSRAVRIGKNAKMSDGEISINLRDYGDDLLYSYDTLGLQTSSKIITQVVSARYKSEVGKEYLFTDKCMEYEIQEHIHAYLFASGKRSAIGENLIASCYILKQMANGKTRDEALQAVVSATEFTDLRESDLNDPMQSLCFHYKDKGSIRESRWQDALAMDGTLDDGYGY